MRLCPNITLCSIWNKLFYIMWVFKRQCLVKVICLIFLLISLDGGDASTNEVETERRVSSKILGPIVKPPTDRREYRALVLSNAMKVLLISDPHTSKAAASLAVSAGSMSDPPSVLGLAHFVEHMLFLGNEKFPTENAFQKFLSEHGGSSNAGTQADETYYFFRVASPFFKDALERFVQFFISPLFTESALEREVQAVNSEHQKYIPDDTRRSERIEAQTTKAGHPYTQFRTGSLETLWTTPKEKGIDIRAALFSFHEKYYSSNIMNLVLMGAEGLDELQAMAEDIFLDVPNRNRTMEVWTDNPCGSEELGERLDIVPTGDTRSLNIIFPVDSIGAYYKNSGLGYLSQVMGNEGIGSLFSVLKSKHWAEHVTVGGVDPARGFSFFKVRITLTPDGLAEVNNVIRHIFQFIEMMRNVGAQKWLWEEVYTITSLHFQFRDDLYPLDLVNKLSVKMDKYPIEKILQAGGVDPDEKFNATHINRIVSLLTPRNCRIFVTSKIFENETKLVEKFYGIKYNRRKIDEQLINDWENCGSNPNFHIPYPNEFIPYEFDMKARDNHTLTASRIPRIILESQLSQAWFLQDNEFRLPKAVIKVQLISPLVYVDPLSTNLNYIFSTLITESLSEFHYNGVIAGLSSEFINTYSGLDITIKGFDHKLGIFVDKIFNKITNFTTDMQHFELGKDSRFRFLSNKKDEQPYQNVNEHLRLLLNNRAWSTAELLEVLEDATLENLLRFVIEFLRRLKFQWFFYGNLTPEECIRIVSDCEKKFEAIRTLPLFSSQLELFRIVELPPGSSYVSKKEQHTHSSSCTAILYQIGLDSTKETVLVQLLSRIAHPYCFDSLRTKEQLGYAAWTEMYSDTNYATHYLRIIVQGNAHPQYVETRIDKFLLDFGEVIQNMTEIEFARHQKSLRIVKATNPKTMDDRASLLHREIRTGRNHFNRQRVELDALDKLTVDDLKQFFNKYVSSSENRRRLVIQIISVVEGGAGRSSNSSLNSTIQSVNIQDPISWKRKMRLFPSYNPFVDEKVLVATVSRNKTDLLPVQDVSSLEQNDESGIE